MSCAEPATERARDIAERVFEAVAEAGGLERAALTAGTPLLEANVDSLTLIAIIARLELVLEVRFDDDESAALIEARDLHELCAVVVHKVGAKSESC